jgi:hypothetical protein
MKSGLDRNSYYHEVSDISRVSKLFSMLDGSDSNKILVFPSRETAPA